MASTTTLPTSGASRQLVLGWAAGALVLGGVATSAVIAWGDGSATLTRPAAVSAPAAVRFGSADAAEQWTSADSVAVEVASADALTRRAAAERERRLDLCRSGSADAAERCIQNG